MQESAFILILFLTAGAFYAVGYRDGKKKGYSKEKFRVIKELQGMNKGVLAHLLYPAVFPKCTCTDPNFCTTWCKAKENFTNDNN